jgi:hypothetical protein
LTLDQRAQKAREELFKRYDALNTLWLKAEEGITKLHIPHAVEVVYGDYPDGHPCECLSIVKIKGKWRICQGSYSHGSYPEGPDDWTPIVECSAAIRVEAVKHLPKLREAIVVAAEKFIPRVNQAIATLERALAADNDMAALLAERAKLNGRAK